MSDHVICASRFAPCLVRTEANLLEEEAELNQDSGDPGKMGGLRRRRRAYSRTMPEHIKPKGQYGQNAEQHRDANLGAKNYHLNEPMKHDELDFTCIVCGRVLQFNSSKFNMKVIELRVMFDCCCTLLYAKWCEWLSQEGHRAFSLILNSQQYFFDYWSLALC